MWTIRQLGACLGWSRDQVTYALKHPFPLRHALASSSTGRRQKLFLLADVVPRLRSRGVGEETIQHLIQKDMTNV